MTAKELGQGNTLRPESDHKIDAATTRWYTLQMKVDRNKRQNVGMLEEMGRLDTLKRY